MPRATDPPARPLQQPIRKAQWDAAWERTLTNQGAPCSRGRARPLRRCPPIGVSGEGGGGGFFVASANGKEEHILSFGGTSAAAFSRFEAFVSAETFLRGSGDHDRSAETENSRPGHGLGGDGVRGQEAPSRDGLGVRPRSGSAAPRSAPAGGERAPPPRSARPSLGGAALGLVNAHRR